MMTNINKINTDILIIGSGLAGFSAGIKALEREKHLDVLMVSNLTGPSGSSFANINQSLGIQICLNDHERETFVKEATALAPPGFIMKSLVRMLAEKSEQIFHDMKHFGVYFKRNHDNEVIRVPGCFSPEQKRAFIITNLAALFNIMGTRFRNLGGNCVTGFQVMRLIIDKKEKQMAVNGAVFQSLNGSERICVRARAVIVASGGTASLFQHHVAGKGSTGITPAILMPADVQFINLHFHQFIWYTRHRIFFPVQAITEKGWQVQTPSGKFETIPDQLHRFSTERASHTPIAYGCEDTAIDTFLTQHASFDGWVRLVSPAGKPVEIIPMAHASNGGVKIDPNGHTGINGLYACGECAGGMHGANRIGGAMVLSALVFGGNAGNDAARHIPQATSNETVSSDTANDKDLSDTQENETEWQEGLAWIGKMLHTHLLPGGVQDTFPLEKTLSDRSHAVIDWRLRKAYQTACLLLSERMRSISTCQD